jgi:hypothetical protein
MWMKNTVIPLSVAFIDANGVILNIEEMKPLTETTHASAGQAQFALEMSGGWFARKRINPGDQIRGLENVPLDSKRGASERRSDKSPVPGFFVLPAKNAQNRTSVKTEAQRRSRGVQGPGTVAALRTARP